MATLSVSVLLIGIVACGATAIVIGLRNNAVYELRMRAIDLAYHSPEWQRLTPLFTKGPSYSAMVFQFWRPLTVREWWPELADAEQEATHVG